MSYRYILDKNNIAIEEPDLIKWAEWFKNADRTVAKTMLGEFCVSTVFIGLNHQFGNGPPLLFETMVFKGDCNTDIDMMRYTTHVQALAGHDQMVAKVQENEEEDKDEPDEHPESPRGYLAREKRVRHRDGFID